MHYVIYGAGGVGGTIGARLHMAGHRVTLIARGEHAEALASRGLTFRTPTETHELVIPTVRHPVELYSGSDTDGSDVMVLLCMKSQHTEAALRDLAQTGVDWGGVACVQNGVANEELALRYFPRVYATVVNLPASHLNPGEIATFAHGQGGILDTGCYPSGSDARAVEFTGALESAGFSAKPDAEVMRWKYAKLLLNLGNVVEAGIRPEEDTKAFAKMLRTEARDCYAAAGIDCAARSEVQARSADVYKFGAVPGIERGGGSSWQSMERGTGDIETEYLNGEICRLGRLYGVSTPANDAAVIMGRKLVQLARGPGQFSLADVLP